MCGHTFKLDMLVTTLSVLKPELKSWDGHRREHTSYCGTTIKMSQNIHNALCRVSIIRYSKRTDPSLSMWNSSSLIVM